MQFTHNAEQGLVSPLNSGYLAYPICYHGYQDYQGYQGYFAYAPTTLNSCYQAYHSTTKFMIVS